MVQDLKKKSKIKVSSSSVSRSDLFMKPREFNCSIRKKHTRVNPTLSFVVKRNPVSFIKNLPPSGKRVLNLLLKIKNNHEHVYIRQSRMAYLLDLSRKTINKWIRKLVSLGILGKVSKWNRSCNYYFSAIFLDPTIRRRLSFHLTALCVVPLTFMYSKAGTPLIKTNPDFNKNKSHYEVHRKPYVQGYFTRGLHEVSLKEYIYIYRLKNIDEFRESQPHSKSLLTLFFNLRFAEEKSPQNNPTRRKLMRPLIPSYIKNIRSISLSLLGKIKLLPFPAEVIFAVDKKLPPVRQLSNPFSYFCKCCVTFCRKNNIKPRWEAAHNFMEAYGIADDGKCLQIPSSVPPAQQNKSTKIQPAAIVPKYQSQITSKYRDDKFDGAWKKWTSQNEALISGFSHDERKKFKTFVHSPEAQEIVDNGNLFLKILLDGWGSS